MSDYIDRLQFYNDNGKYREYVDKYCKKHGISPENAIKTIICRAVYDQYKAEYDREIAKTGQRGYN